MNNTNLFTENNHYAMSLSCNSRFAGKHILDNDNLIAAISVRMQILIPQLNTNHFYRLSIVDGFNINSLSKDKYEISYVPDDSITLLLIRKPKDSADDITNHADILLPINSTNSSEFMLKKCIDELNKYVNNEENIANWIVENLNKRDLSLVANIINKEDLKSIAENVNSKINSFLNKVYSNDVAGLIKEYSYIENYSLIGITDAIQENDKLYEAKLSHDNLHKELVLNQPIQNKKNKL